MTIYLDIVVLENVCMNFIILFSVAYILKLKIQYLRIILSAVMGAVYSILVYINILPIYSNFFMKVLLSIAMVYLAYGAKKIKLYLKQFVLFYLVSFVFGGCSIAVLYFIKPQEILTKNGIAIESYPLKIALLGGILGFVVTVISFKLVKYRLSKKDVYCKVELIYKEKQIKINAILDTGNMLKDPITGDPVIIVEKDMLKEIIPEVILNNINQIMRGGELTSDFYNKENIEYISKFKMIPFMSLGKQNGMLVGFKISKILIYIDSNVEEIQNVVVGMYDKKLSTKNKYNALIGLDILDRSEVVNEYIESINR